MKDVQNTTASVDNLDGGVTIIPADNTQSSDNVGVLSGKTSREIIQDLLNDGCKMFRGVKVRNIRDAVLVSNSTGNDYSRLSFSIVGTIPAMVRAEDGTYSLGVSNTVYCRTSDISGAMKDNEEYAWMANEIYDKPKLANMMLNGGTIDIIQRHIKAGEEYSNPFTTSFEPRITKAEHDTIINHIVNLRLGKGGEKNAMMLARMHMESFM